VQEADPAARVLRQRRGSRCNGRGTVAGGCYGFEQLLGRAVLAEQGSPSSERTSDFGGIVEGRMRWRSTFGGSIGGCFEYRSVAAW